MALNLQGFVTPEQSWGGLSDISRNLRIDEQRKEQDRLRQEAGKAANTKFLTDFLDQKEFLTGTPNDPYIVGQLNQIMQEGADLIGKGVDNSQLLMALSPKVGRLSQQSQTLKGMAAQKRQAIDLLKSNPAIDVNKFSAAFDELFFEKDKSGKVKLREITDFDPSKNYADEILNTKAVYTPAGFDAFVGKAGAVTERSKLQTKDSRGALSIRDMELSAPEFMQPEFDEKGVFTRNFIPKYEIAINDQKPIITKFMDEQGRQVDAELRLLDKNTFANLPKDALAYVMQEAREFAQQEGIPIQDGRVEMFARALAYDSLKNSAKQKTSAKEIVVQQAAPAPKVNVSVSTGGGGQGQTYDDAFGQLEATVRNYKPGELVPLSEAPQVLFDDLLKKGRAGSVMPTALSSNNVFVKLDGSELVLVIKDVDNKEKRILKLGRVATNRQANPKDRGTQQTIIKEGQGGGTPAPKAKKGKLY
jgi:hypothetical protein